MVSTRINVDEVVMLNIVNFSNTTVRIHDGLALPGIIIQA